jgi:hypothetical protein
MNATMMGLVYYIARSRALIVKTLDLATLGNSKAVKGRTAYICSRAAGMNVHCGCVAVIKVVAAVVRMV